MPLSQPIDTYRQPWESVENWELREEFLLRYQDSFEENRLLCLAQAYVNILLLGCQYPEAVMQEVKNLGRRLEKGGEVRGAKNERIKQNSRKKLRTQPAEQLGTSTSRSWKNSGKNAHNFF
ncbi:CDKN2AIP N-terminal protein-like [Tropilaelaps mercedesae]|uniref:CDKN2AIP N-terminal protein-like n=1 Tax=Tropilaelaps mercedesae TaxID=418985 RepID=A0A1V9X5I4_9ACAR|nr:CDKN2AIP N-terminal protein-like [Tropilaelaps mercedesae]